MESAIATSPFRGSPYVVRFKGELHKMESLNFAFFPALRRMAPSVSAFAPKVISAVFIRMNLITATRSSGHFMRHCANR